MNDSRYLKWAVKEMVCWDQKEVMPGVIHIHGDSDRVFPVKYIKNPILVSGGSHIMVITKHRWFNKNLLVIVAINAVQKPADTTSDSTKEELINDYNVYALPIPEGLNFVGEPVPVHNPDIKERVDRELLVNTYWQSNALLLMWLNTSGISS